MRRGRPLFRGAAAVGEGLSAAALAPMVDMMTILVVAILRTWSHDAPLDVLEEGFRLPLSSQETPANSGVTVEVGLDGLYVDGWRAGSAAYWAESEDIQITEIHEALQRIGGERVIIRAHESASWSLVGKVLFTAQQAGYEHIELVAVSRVSL